MSASRARGGVDAGGVDAGIDAAAGGPPRALADLRDDDLYALLVAFYEAVERDPMLEPYFAPVDMTAHMPRIVDFWSSILFQTGRYAGNAFRPHAEMPGLTGEHFVRWLATLERTVGARFEGPAADRMKDVAHRIAYSMQIRLGIAPFERYSSDGV